MSESLVFFALISLLILVPSESNAYETCFENDISWTNTSSKTSIHPISSPEECQGLCFDRQNCSKWTLSLDKEICLLFSSDGNKIPFPGSVSGPRSCDISFSCEANGENIISAVSNVTSEENCQELCCQDYDKCKFYTWYEPTSIMSNYCFLLSSCNNQNSDCPDCRSGPNCYSEFFVEKALVVTGGIPTYHSVEILHKNGTFWCTLEDFPVSRAYHTQTGMVTCGGEDTQQSCVKFSVDGNWQEFGDLQQHRTWHNSWLQENGDTMLIGGGESMDTTEIITSDADNKESFNLKYDIQNACSIELSDRMILTGGILTQNRATEYNSLGFAQDLPSFNDGRWFHGCGFFINGDHEIAFLVTGGTTGSTFISSTEILVDGGLVWSYGPSLESGRVGLCSVSLENNIVIAGGRESSGRYMDEILTLQNDQNNSLKWIQIGNLRRGRQHHACSKIDLKSVQDIAPFCQ